MVSVRPSRPIDTHAIVRMRSNGREQTVIVEIVCSAT
jgi:hypothetical protein